MGHFIPAKLFKTRVEKFYLFFDPWFSLFKFKKGDTEYGIGWLPLGGYVKISGMIDESMDKEQMKLPAQPWEFRAKPAWQRLIIMVGGVTVNVILGILIYSMILFTWGEKFLPAKNAKYGIAADSLALEMGLRNGDKIISVANKPLETLEKVPFEIVLNNAKSIEVERNGEKIILPIKQEIFDGFIKGKIPHIQAGFPTEVDSVIKDMPADMAGLLKRDKILAVNEVETPFFQDVVKELQKNKAKPVALKIEREGAVQMINLTVSEQGTVGFSTKNIDKFLDFETKNYSFLESLPAGVHKGYETFDNYAKQMKILFTVPEAHKSIGGFISIGKAYDTVWNWPRFWSFTAFLSIVLAFMNILPIPALDGGHVMFLLYEVISGRKPNEKFMEYAQYAGMLLLLMLLVYANGNDVVRIFTK